jgi:hypothetical protein
MATLGLSGGLLLALNVVLPSALASGFELLVALVLVVLGVWRLVDAARGIASVSAEHLIADHEHPHRRRWGVPDVEAVHSHPHGHGQEHHPDSSPHAHPHVHPSRRLLEALAGDGRRMALRAVLVGAVHGMAGTAGVSLLVMATLHSLSTALLFLAIFGVGTVAGMIVLSTAVAFPVALAARFRRAPHAVAIGCGLASIVFGVYYGVLALRG